MYTDLGNSIRKKRIEKSLSLEELAWRCEMHLNGIWNVEKAKSEIKLSTLMKIFKVLEIDFCELNKYIR